jgi:hypothetical protein
MRKVLAVIGIFGSLFATSLISCEKSNSSPSGKSYTTTQSNSSSVPMIGFESPSIYVDIGTHLFSGCNYDNPCGPCPGICVRRGKNPRKNHVFDAQLLANGEGAFAIRNISSNTITIEFQTTGFTSGTLTGLEDSLHLGASIASDFGKTDIIIHPGTLSSKLYEFSIREICGFGNNYSINNQSRS